MNDMDEEEDEGEDGVDWKIDDVGRKDQKKAWVEETVQDTQFSQQQQDQRTEGEGAVWRDWDQRNATCKLAYENIYCFVTFVCML